jgi:hypothetical protein
MLTVETIGRIRREHFLKGKTIKEIARDPKVSRNTVRKVLRSGETSFEYEREVQPPTEARAMDRRTRCAVGQQRDQARPRTVDVDPPDLAVCGKTLARARVC